MKEHKCSLVLCMSGCLSVATDLSAGASLSVISGGHCVIFISGNRYSVNSPPCGGEMQWLTRFVIILINEVNLRRARLILG